MNFAVGCRWRLGTDPSSELGSQDASIERPVPINSTILEYRSQSVSLTNGMSYYLTLIAANGACPERVVSIVSDRILVDR